MEIGVRARGSDLKLCPLAAPTPFLNSHLPINGAALRELFGALDRLRAAALEFFFSLLLLGDRGAAGGFALVDLLLHGDWLGHRGPRSFVAVRITGRGHHGED